MGNMRRDIDKISLTFRNIQSLSLMNDGVVFMRWLTAYLIFSRMSLINVILSWIGIETILNRFLLIRNLPTISNMNDAVGVVISSATHRVISHDIQVSRKFLISATVTSWRVRAQISFVPSWSTVNFHQRTPRFIVDHHMLRSSSSEETMWIRHQIVERQIAWNLVRFVVDDFRWKRTLLYIICRTYNNI